MSELLSCESRPLFWVGRPSGGVPCWDANRNWTGHGEKVKSFSICKHTSIDSLRTYMFYKNRSWKKVFVGGPREAKKPFPLKQRLNKCECIKEKTLSLRNTAPNQAPAAPKPTVVKNTKGASCDFRTYKEIQTSGLAPTSQ